MQPRAPALTAALLMLLAAGAAPSRADDPFLRRTTTVDVVERVGPAVVNITTRSIVEQRSPFRSFGGDPFFDQFFRDFFEPRGRRRETQNLGSGVLIDRQGHILTNEHVVRRATRIEVTLSDGRVFTAHLVGADPNNDVAVLQIEADEELPWIGPGEASDLMVGEPVIAIGNPFGLSSTVTTGVLSAVDRSLRTQSHVFHGFLQTDASINPGNSGGPLLNAEGELIGINTAIYQGAQGIGFAIPIDVASRIMSDLLDDGEVTPVWLGLGFQNLDTDLASAFELPAGTTGALVNQVKEGSPALRAGVRRGDVVTHLDDRPVRSAQAFFEMLGSTTVGQDIELRLWREGNAVQVPVRVEAIPVANVDRLSEDLLGMQLEALEQGGFRVTSVRKGSGAARVGVQRGDLLLGINGRRLEDHKVLRRSLLELRGRATALIMVQRGNGRYNVTVPLV